MKKIKVGIIQQSNTADIRVNLMNLAKSIEACAAHGAQLIVLQELHNSLYFCQTENTNRKIIGNSERYADCQAKFFRIGDWLGNIIIYLFVTTLCSKSLLLILLY